MPKASLPVAPKVSDFPTLLLEMERGGGEAPLRVPVIIRNLTGSLVILEVENPWYLMGWDDLKGRAGLLCFTPPGGAETVCLKGKVASARHAGKERRDLALGLEMGRVAPAKLKLVEATITHSAKDIKSLWDRWDQGHKKGIFDSKVCQAGLILVLAGFILQLPEFPPFKFYGWLLWFLASAGVAANGLWSLWHNRTLG